MAEDTKPDASIAMSPLQYRLQGKLKRSLAAISAEAQRAIGVEQAVQMVCNLLVMHLLNLALFTWKDPAAARAWIDRLISHHLPAIVAQQQAKPEKANDG